MKKYWIIFTGLMISLSLNAQTYQFLDATGKALSQEKFNDYKSSQTAFLQVKKGELWGVLDTKKGLIIDCEYEEIKQHKIYTDVFALKKDGNWGIMNASGKVLLPFEYEEIKSFGFSENYCGKSNKSDFFINILDVVIGDW